MKILLTDTPMCKEGKAEVVVGALKQETVSLFCTVDSHPPPLTFHWTFNNSGELNERPEHNSILNYTPATDMDYGTIACWASNQVGKQRAPCLFQVSLNQNLLILIPRTIYQGSNSPLPLTNGAPISSQTELHISSW